MQFRAASKSGATPTMMTRPCCRRSGSCISRWVTGRHLNLNSPRIGQRVSACEPGFCVGDNPDNGVNQGNQQNLIRWGDTCHSPSATWANRPRLSRDISPFLRRSQTPSMPGRVWQRCQHHCAFCRVQGLLASQATPGTHITPSWFDLLPGLWHASCCPACRSKPANIR